MNIRVHLACLGDREAAHYLPIFERLAGLDRTKSCELVANPDEADIIFMTDIAVGGDQWWRLETFNAHPWVQEARPNLYIYNELDFTWAVYQGLYCSMPRFAFNPWRQRAAAYCEIKNPYVEKMAGQRDEVATCRLFSFAGANNTPVRSKLLRIQHPRAAIADTSSFNLYEAEGMGTTAAEDRMRSYVEGLLESKYVVCPRGLGTGSVRLFETMALGRVPVILSDAWVAPRGPRWAECSLRVREADVERLPEILSDVESGWARMAEAARAEWERWFAPEVTFRRMMEACLDLRDHRGLPERIWRRLPEPQQAAYRLRGGMSRLRHLGRRLMGGRAGAHAAMRGEDRVGAGK